MKDGVRDYVLGMAVGSFFGALVSCVFIGFVLGLRIGAYVHTKLDERGQVAPHVSQQCKTQGGFK